jgi:hypothetical protein
VQRRSNRSSPRRERFKAIQDIWGSVNKDPRVQYGKVRHTINT